MFNKATLFGGSFTKVYTPTITSPTASQLLNTRTPTITSSAFSKYGNITHASTDWQVSDSSDFNTIRWLSVNDSTNKISITSTDLKGGNRYVRVRHKASNGNYSDWSDPILFTIPVQTPVVLFTSNLSSTHNRTAGDSSSFSVDVVDADNTNATNTISYQWYLSTDGGNNYSPISGKTTNTLDRYSTFYRSDNGHKIKCRVSITNSVGSNSADSEVCTLTVARNYDCNSSTVTGTQSFGSGLKPSTNGNGDEQWWEWSPGYSDICSIDGNLSSFNAKGRFCNWNMELELRITKSTGDGGRVHWGSQQKSGSQQNYQTFDNVKANGGVWNPNNDGTPTYRLMVIDNGTNCTNNSSQDIGCESGAITLNYSYKRANLYFETRP
ncbi:MAG: hypothetical protein EBU90_23970 [Proteobacteria bacterium]|nr:hypothetical protein [Pseudomonadota bacterium]